MVKNLNILQFLMTARCREDHVRVKLVENKFVTLWQLKNLQLKDSGYKYLLFQTTGEGWRIHKSNQVEENATVQYEVAPEENIRILGVASLNEALRYNNMFTV